MPAWSDADIPDQAGRVVVVTGATSGLGRQTALALARRGASVTLAVRDADRGAAAKGFIKREVPAADVSVGLVDLASLASVADFAAEFVGTHPGVDVLVNNAGVMALPRRTTVDGFELQFATNHLGHFALTGRLLPLLLARPGARVVTVSSGAAQMGRMHFSDLEGERRYQRWMAYAQSKLANLLFAFELDRRVRAAGVDLVSVAAHPGYAATNLQAVGPRMTGNMIAERMADFGNRLVAQSDAQGALPQLYAATAPGVQGGDYFGPDGLFGLRGAPTKVRPPGRALDAAAAHLLWDRSEELTEVRYRELDASA